jgi:hypothetical protein
MEEQDVEEMDEEEEEQEGDMFPNEEEAVAEDGSFQHFSSLDKGAEVEKGIAVRNQLSK